MKKANFWRNLLCLGLCLSLAGLLFSGCNKTTTTKSQDETSKENVSDPLRVAAAADLTLAFQEIGNEFEKQNGKKVEFNFSSSGTLAQQIESGAPFDVVALADIKFVDGLKDKGLIIPETQKLYAQGRIGLATKTTSSLEVKEMKDLLKPEIKKIAIADPSHAPYGLAAKQALEKAGLWEQLKDKMVYGKNIQDTLTLINTGNADAGIIALSIVKKDEVNFSLINPDMHSPLDQSMAIIKSTKQEQLARKFSDYVNGQEGRAIMKKYGFVLPGEAL